MSLFSVTVATPSGVVTINVLACSKWHAKDIVKSKSIKGTVLSVKPKKI